MQVEFVAPQVSSIEADLLVFAVGDVAGMAPVAALLGVDLTAYADRHGFQGKAGTGVTLPTLGRLKAPEVAFVGVGGGTPAERDEAWAKAGRLARGLKAATVALVTDDAADRVYEAFAIGNYAYEPYQQTADRTDPCGRLVIASANVSTLSAGAVRARWQAWARDLVNAPPAEIYPESLGAKAQALAALPNVEVVVWDAAKLEQEGCVGILAVGQGSSRPPTLIHVRYRPAGARDTVALVGKGITFDSGGLSLKPSASMQTMRCDMAGAATMLAATAAAAELGIPVAIDCFVAAAENAVDGNNYKLGDILRYRNGVTVEIHNTDAEGRLVLADALMYAGEVPGVTAIVDAATLTGACVVALGSDFTGLFTGDEALASALHAAAADNGEGLWRLPLHAPYRAMLKADWSTIKNVGGREAGATTAALFLQHFVPKGMSWAHLDIAGPAFLEKGTNKYAAGGTGEMVRTLVTWLDRRGR